MEFRQIKASDLDSLLELYKQLDEDDHVCSNEQYEKVWKEIEKMRISGISVQSTKDGLYRPATRFTSRTFHGAAGGFVLLKMLLQIKITGSLAWLPRFWRWPLHLQKNAIVTK